MNCSYCNTENNTDNIKCTFCNAELHTKRVKYDSNFIVTIAINYDFQRLNAIHTLNLLELLHYVRQERTYAYKNMQSIRKAPQHALNALNVETDVYNEFNEQAQSTYRELTAKKNLVEQILIDRMGYYPRRVDDKLIAKYHQKIAKE